MDGNKKCAEKWMDLEIIMLNEISKSPKAKCHVFCSPVESTPKMMMMRIIMCHECKRGTVCEEISRKTEGERKE
jgi:hypothetical protein